MQPGARAAGRNLIAQLNATALPIHQDKPAQERSCSHFDCAQVQIGMLCYQSIYRALLNSGQAAAWWPHPE